MSEKLCKCFICQRENPELGGKVLSVSTVRKHRKRELKWIKSVNTQNITQNRNTEIRWVFSV